MADDQKNPAVGGSELSFDDFKREVLADYKLASESREASLLGRKEVLTGKAKFGIFGDGKEVAQLALAKCFKPGDFRSGYYRDQTLMLASGEVTLEHFFAQLYAVPDIQNDPNSGGRQMNAHFATRSLDANGEWNDLTKIRNTAADNSPTANQMLRAMGLAHASKVYRQNKIANASKFSDNGNEVCFATIGDASTSEGHFWEAVNAAGVSAIPLVFLVWDDGYGISVSKDYQTTKGNISTLLEGYQPGKDGKGVHIYKVNGWDYPALCEAFAAGVEQTRKTHVPCLFHVQELTQPQGHSTSGSHERYKSKERLGWEKDFDCNRKLREWIVSGAIATEAELEAIEKAAKKTVQESRNKAWDAFINPIKEQISRLEEVLDEVAAESASADDINAVKQELQKLPDPFRKDVFIAIKKVLRITRSEQLHSKDALLELRDELEKDNRERFSSHLHSESAKSALKVSMVQPQYDSDAAQLSGYEILNKNFDAILAKYDNVVAFGEDLGKIGDVNQGFAGLQEKYGESRIFDVGIREATIMGQGIGMAMRGLRPIAEIQYLDYLLYGLEPLSDDLATLHYRTRGGQKAPLIIRTRGHRLEGIWHTGSPMGMILGALRGIYVLVPRDMTRAAGFYNTLLQGDDPALVVECLNGYRLKERLPSNIGEYTVPLGVPETLQQGTDVTLVTYGSCVRIAQEGVKLLEETGISVELIDVQSLLPFDINHAIVDSLKKTNKLVVLDEDVPGGASAYILQQVLEVQKGYYHLDTEPRTISAQPHRAPYGSDGDYFSKPNAEDIFETVYRIMNDSAPTKYPMFF